MEIFDKFIIIEEKRFGIWHKNSLFQEVTQFETLQFKIDANVFSLEVKDNDNCRPQQQSTQSMAAEPLAQIIPWGWNDRGQMEIREAKILNRGGTIKFRSISYANANGSHLASVIVRILRKRGKPDENPCPPPFNAPENALTVQIGNQEITLSAHWLASISPVFQRMLTVEMREKQHRSLILNDLGVNMEQFREFLEAISPIGLHKPILPNPKNVLVLLKLADFFQIDFLKKRCDLHLINCVELSLIDRFLLIERFHLNKLKNFFLYASVCNLRAFFKTNSEQLLREESAVNKELLIKLTSRLCEN